MQGINRKVQQMVLFFCRESVDDPSFGKTKLLKLLAFTDFLAYFKRGRSVTGAHYIKQEHGPVPREFPTVLLMSEKTGVIETGAEDVAGGYEQTRLRALAEPDMSLFTKAEIADAREVLERFRNTGNRAIRNVSHDQFIGWNLVAMKREIPNHTVYLSPADPTAEDVRRGRDLAAEYGW